MYGREPLFPIDTMLESEEIYRSSTEYVSEIIRKLKIAKEMVKDNIMQIKQKRDDNNTKMNKLKSFAVGEYVMLFNPSSKKGISAKLIHKWRGPFVIVTQTSPVNYLITKADNGKKTDHVHVSRLKSCYIRDETYNGLKFLSKMKTSDDAVHASKIKNKDESKNSMTTSKEEFEIEGIVDKQLDEISQEWWYRVR